MLRDHRGRKWISYDALPIEMQRTVYTRYLEDLFEQRSNPHCVSTSLGVDDHEESLEYFLTEVASEMLFNSDENGKWHVCYADELEFA